MNEWWRVLVVHKGTTYYYTVKSRDILTAINMVMVAQECGVECVIKAKIRKINPSFAKHIEKHPERVLFRGTVEDE